MFKISKLVVTAALGVAVSVSACKKDEAKSEAPSAAPAAKATDPKEIPPKEIPPTADDSAPSTDTSYAQSIMKPYEDCRVLLAADKGEGVSDCANAIAAAAKAAQTTAPEAAKAALGEVASAADTLSKAGADDIEAIRLAYGEVSKPVVAMLTASPESAAHYHVFECPMAKGYQRWVQPEEKLTNPYMGKRMLGCGSEVSLNEPAHVEEAHGDDHHDGDHGHKQDDDHGHKH